MHRFISRPSGTLIHFNNRTPTVESPITSVVDPLNGANSGPVGRAARAPLNIRELAGPSPDLRISAVPGHIRPRPPRFPALNAGLLRMTPPRPSGCRKPCAPARLRTSAARLHPETGCPNASREPIRLPRDLHKRRPPRPTRRRSPAHRRFTPAVAGCRSPAKPDPARPSGRNSSGESETALTDQKKRSGTRITSPG